MNILTMLALIAAVAVVFVTLAYVLDWKPIENWYRVMVKSWSSRLTALALAVQSAFPGDPISGLGLWNMVPADVKRLLPPHISIFVGLALVLLAWLSRHVHQETLHNG